MFLENKNIIEVQSRERTRNLLARGLKGAHGNAGNVIRLAMGASAVG
jgi:hypothetical protein